MPSIYTSYLQCFIYKLPSLYSISCSKDITKLNSRGHIFQLLLTRAPFQCLQHFGINNLAFLFTGSQAMLTWLLRNLILPANWGLRCVTDSPGDRMVPTRQQCQPRWPGPAWPLSQPCCSHCSQAMGSVSSSCAAGRRSQRASQGMCWEPLLLSPMAAFITLGKNSSLPWKAGSVSILVLCYGYQVSVSTGMSPSPQTAQARTLSTAASPQPDKGSGRNPAWPRAVHTPWHPRCSHECQGTGHSSYITCSQPLLTISLGRSSKKKKAGGWRFKRF